MESKKTSLYEEHLHSHATMVEFASFLMPIYYQGIVEEHQAIRTNVGMFDVSHMGEILVCGRDATAFLEYVFSNHLQTAKVDSCTYGFLCNQEGGIVDDLIVYKFHDEKYLLVVNASNIASDFEWLNQNKTGFVLDITNVSDAYSQIALQGPNARIILGKLLKKEITLPAFTFMETTLYMDKMIISATGYTGEDGFEIYGSHQDIVQLWRQLRDEFGVLPCGLGCRDTLRFEANMPLYGHEIDSDITPLEAGFGFALDWNKYFIGIEALELQKKEGLTRKIVGLELLDKGVMRQGYKVYFEDKEVGYITTGYVSPTLNKAIALALIDVKVSTLGTLVEVEIRNKRLSAVVRNRKFYQKKNKQ